MKNSTCFVTVIFPDNVIYFSDFIASLNNQTDKNFELLIFNDGVENLDKEIESLEISSEIINLPKGITLAENRSFVLQYLKQSDFEYAIFGDSDDYFPKNRVEVNLYYLQDFDVVINDTHLVDINKQTLVSKYFNILDEEEITFDKIKNKNCCGLGNTAIRINALPLNLVFNSNIAAIDWMLFSRMLIEGKTAIYTNKTYIYYRQHNLNAIGFKTITKERLLKGISIKQHHYANLVKQYGNCKLELEEINILAEYCSNEDNLITYWRKILSLNLQNPMWWEEIKSLKELKITE